MENVFQSQSKNYKFRFLEEREQKKEELIKELKIKFPDVDERIISSTVYFLHIVKWVSEKFK